jgi:hypothetical protein
MTGSSQVPNRPRAYRSWRITCSIPDAFVEVAGGAYFARDCRRVRGRGHGLDRRAGRLRTRGAQQVGNGGSQADKSRSDRGNLYGPQSCTRSGRATWHIGQHCRQWMMLLEMPDCPERSLADTDFVDLPMPKQVWDG